MIEGFVNSNYELQVEVHLLAAGGGTQVVKAVLDTGFSGHLTLPMSVIEPMGFPFRSIGYGTLANGQLEEFEEYVAIVIWNGRPRRLFVQAVESTPLLGMRLRQPVAC
jgi:predicted aspartyl protease